MSTPAAVAIARAHRFGSRMPTRPLVPPLLFLTASTACSITTLRVCCAPLPTLGFTWFQRSPEPCCARSRASVPTQTSRREIGLTAFESARATRGVEVPSTRATPHGHPKLLFPSDAHTLRSFPLLRSQRRVRPADHRTILRPPTADRLHRDPVPSRRSAAFPPSAEPVGV